MARVLVEAEFACAEQRLEKPRLRRDLLTVIAHRK